MIGTFGSVVFEVSADRIRTFEGLQRKSAARFAEHEVQAAKPLLEYLGGNLDEVTIDVRFSASFGVKPLAEINALREILSAGEATLLVIGGKRLGAFALTGLNETWRQVDNRGVLITADVSLSLKEYVDAVG